MSPEKKNKGTTRFSDPSDINLQVEKAREQIEILRRQQEELQREKSELEDLKLKYSELIEGKKNLIEGLSNGITVLDAEEQEAERMHELAAETKRQFKDILADISAIRENILDDENVNEQIGRGLTLIDRGRRTLNKARGKIDALTEKAQVEALSPEDELPAEKSEHMTFGDALRLGFAFSVPGLVLAIIVILLARALMR